MVCIGAMIKYVVYLISNSSSLLFVYYWLSYIGFVFRLCRKHLLVQGAFLKIFFVIFLCRLTLYLLFHSSLFALVGTYIAVLSRSAESKPICLFLSLRVKAFRLSLDVMLLIGFSWIPFIRLMNGF